MRFLQPDNEEFLDLVKGNHYDPELIIKNYPQDHIGDDHYESYYSHWTAEEVENFCIGVKR
jgi:hypothetical protein